MSVAEAVTAATRSVAASEITPKRTRTPIVYKNEIVTLSEVAASPCEGAAQSKGTRLAHNLPNFTLPLSRQLSRQDRGPSTLPAQDDTVAFV